MKVKITIKMDNEAFSDLNSGNEIARILRQLAEEVAGVDLSPISERPLRDINGNTVGEFKVTT